MVKEVQVVSNVPGKEVTENRQKYVGGSDIPAILNISDFKNQFQLALEKAEIIPVEFKGNEYTRYGQLMEPLIRDYFNASNTYKFSPATQIDEKLFLRSNTDGFDKNANMIIEIKTNNGKHTDINDYVMQMQMYMYQFDVPNGYLIQYKRPDDFYKGLDYESQKTDDFFNITFDPNAIQVYEIKRDEVLIDMILSEVDKFWKRVSWLKEHKDASEIDYYMCLDSGALATCNEQIKALEVLEVKLEQMKELETQAKLAREKVYQAMDKVGIKSLDTPRLKITKIDPTVATTLDSKAIKEKYPDIYDECKKTTNKKGYIKITLKEADAPVPKIIKSLDTLEDDTTKKKTRKKAKELDDAIIILSNKKSGDDKNEHTAKE